MKFARENQDGTQRKCTYDKKMKGRDFKVRQKKKVLLQEEKKNTKKKKKKKKIEKKNKKNRKMKQIKKKKKKKNRWKRSLCISRIIPINETENCFAELGERRGYIIINELLFKTDIRLNKEI